MKQKLVIIASVLTLAISGAKEVNAQWASTNGPNGGRINTLFETNMNLIAGTDSGIFLTAGNRSNWTQKNTGLPPKATAVSFAESGIDLFVSIGEDRIYISKDQGASWTPSNNGLPSDFGVGPLAVSGSNLFAGIGGLQNVDGGGVYRSTDSGANWIVADSGLTGYDELGDRDTQIVVTFAVNENCIFAATLVGNGFGVCLSTDSGISWNLAGGVGYISCLAVIGSNLFAGGNTVYLSTDSGKNWTVRDNGLPIGSPVTAIKVIGSNLFVGTIDSGVFVSTDSGKSWTVENAGLPLHCWITSIASVDTDVYVGTDSNGVYQRPLSQMLGSSDVTSSPSPQATFSAFPNPLTQSTTINFTSQESGSAEISVVNLLGEEVAKIFSGELDAGEHSFTWNTTCQPPGTYWCKVGMNGRYYRILVVLLR